MKKYSILFAIAYLILTYGIGEVAERMQINAGVTLNIVATLIAVFVAAWWFGRQQKRRPTPLEINSFSLQGLIGAWLASTVLTIYILTFEASGAEVMAMLSQLSMTVLIIGGLICSILISLLYYFIIRLSFIGFTKLLQPA